MALMSKIFGRNKTTVRDLTHGSVTVIPCGDVQVHVYNTKNPIGDQVILLVKNKRAVVVELPAFKDSIEEMTRYIGDEGLTVEGKLVAYHAAGRSFLPDVKSYMTASSKAYNTNGGGFQLVQKFTGAFGDAFDSSVENSGEIIPAGRFTLAGIEMEIRPDSDAFEVTVPSIKAVYMHMLGHDCHSIVAGAGHADAIIANLRGYLDQGYELFLSAHYGPETRKDVETKIAYLEDLKTIAKESTGADDFRSKVNAKYAGYSGGNYLDMTAGFFFPQ